MQTNYPYLPALRALVASARMQNHLGVQARLCCRGAAGQQLIAAQHTSARLFIGARAALAAARWYKLYCNPASRHYIGNRPAAATC